MFNPTMITTKKMIKSSEIENIHNALLLIPKFL